MPSVLEPEKVVLGVLQRMLQVLEREELETYAGTRGGGMDWGVCVGCQNVDVACSCGSRSVMVKREAMCDAVGGGLAGNVAVADSDERAGAVGKRERVGVGVAVVKRERVKIEGNAYGVVGAGAFAGSLSARAARVVLHQETYVPSGLVEEYWTDLQLRLLQQNVFRAQTALTRFDDVVSHELLLGARFQFLERLGTMLWRRHDIARHRGMHAQPGYNWAADALFEDAGYLQAIALELAEDPGISRRKSVRDSHERTYFLRLAHVSRIVRSLLPEFRATMSGGVPALTDWMRVAIAFGGGDIGCQSALEHARWLWLVRLVQGAAPYFCPATLAALALLAANCQQLRGLVACWAGVTGEPFHFTAGLNADVVARAVAWLYLRPSIGVVGDRVRLLELTLDYPDRLNPRCHATVHRTPLVEALDLLPVNVCCDYLCDGGAYVFAPPVPHRLPLRTDPHPTISNPFPPNHWHRSFNCGVPSAVPWVLGFVAVRPPNLITYDPHEDAIALDSSSDTGSSGSASP
jgi:hypothetical protein